jgi:SAM-dependent methyltransferase
MKHTWAASGEDDISNVVAILGRRPFNLSLKNVVSYLLGKTPARILQDDVCAQVIPSMVGSIIEIGSYLTQNYSRFVSAAGRYEGTNIDPKAGYRVLDATDMDLADDSVDNFVCVSVLEHIALPQRAIDEMHRSLRPGGLALITYPFMFPFHGAPSDYSRYTYVGLIHMFRKFRIDKIEVMGNLWLTISLFLHHPLGWDMQPKSILGRVATRMLNTVCRGIGLIFLVLGSFSKRPDGYECFYAVHARKVAQRSVS